MHARKLIICTFAAMALAGCTPSTDDVAKDVRPLLQSQLESGELKQYGLKVQKVEVMHEDGNKFQGIATITMDGEEHTIPIQILDDGKKVMYTAQPEALGFVVQAALKRAVTLANPPPPIAAQPLLDLEKTADERCRGGSGDDPNTDAACKRRDELVGQLRALGQCYGPPDEIEANKRWGPCAAQ